MNQSPMDSESSIVAATTALVADAIDIPQPPPLPTATPTPTGLSETTTRTRLHTAPPIDAVDDHSTCTPTDRDVVFPKESSSPTTTIASPQEPTRKANILLLDLIRLHRLLWQVHDKPQPEKPEELEEVTKHILRTLRDGKPFELAGIYDVPRPFLKSTGRFFQETEGEDGIPTYTYTLLDEPSATTLLNAMILQEFTTTTDEGEGDDANHNMDESPYKDLKAWVLKQATSSVVSADLVPEGNDAMLLRCADNTRSPQQHHLHTNHLYEHQQQYGNKILFSLVSQLVTVQQAVTIRQRVDAALHLMKGMDEAAAVAAQHAKDLTTTAHARFLIRKVQLQDQSISWDVMDAASAAEFCLIFVFEVFVEKEIYLEGVESSSSKEHEEVRVSGTPVLGEPNNNDVLFGRGGMTNSHPGNKRFRDVIALHRPDYIRASKMEKPSVARRIVRSIRVGPPAGRFLKKGDDGYWYDVGDRAAAEKTSQGLRERSNAEKRQRSALREALRIRKQDLAEDAETPRKKAKHGDAITDLSAAMAPTLNYIGTNLPVPLSLSMKDPISVGAATAVKTTPVVKKKSPAAVIASPVTFASPELNTAGLPPNSVDTEGNAIVTDYDILCGRGGLTNHHKGNKRFRDIVALHRPDYVRAPKVQKPSVARVIVRAIRNGDPPGRFLRKDEKTGCWVDIGDKKATEKTSQALREKTTEEREKIKASPLLQNPSAYLTPGGLFTSVDAATAATVEAAGVAAATVDAAGVPQANLGVPGVLANTPTVPTATDGTSAPSVFKEEAATPTATAAEVANAMAVVVAKAVAKDGEQLAVMEVDYSKENDAKEAAQVDTTTIDPLQQEELPEAPPEEEQLTPKENGTLPEDEPTNPQQDETLTPAEESPIKQEDVEEALGGWV